MPQGRSPLSTAQFINELRKAWWAGLTLKDDKLPALRQFATERTKNPKTAVAALEFIKYFDLQFIRHAVLAVRNTLPLGKNWAVKVIDFTPGENSGGDKKAALGSSKKSVMDRVTLGKKGSITLELEREAKKTITVRENNRSNIGYIEPFQVEAFDKTQQKWVLVGIFDPKDRELNKDEQDGYITFSLEFSAQQFRVTDLGKSPKMIGGDGHNTSGADIQGIEGDREN